VEVATGRRPVPVDVAVGVDRHRRVPRGRQRGVVVAGEQGDVAGVQRRQVRRHEPQRVRRLQHDDRAVRQVELGCPGRDVTAQLAVRDGSVPVDQRHRLGPSGAEQRIHRAFPDLLRHPSERKGPLTPDANQARPAMRRRSNSP
jgi:hypothetical protein